MYTFIYGVPALQRGRRRDHGDSKNDGHEK
jgi:hypothetical protein